VTAPVGTILVLPGGGYSAHAPHEAEPIAEWLEALGWRARVIRYPVSARHPLPLGAVRAAVAAERDAGATTVGVLGFSAGGHLAGHAALAPDSADDERPDFAVLGYAVTSMIAGAHSGSREVLTGGDDDLAEAVSLERLVRPGGRPIFLWHTVDDPVVGVGHAYLLAQALADAHVPHELHTFPGDVHGVGLATGTAAAAWTALCAQWLTRWDAAAPST
jgi:acetyl esterase/lipase